MYSFPQIRSGVSTVLSFNSSTGLFIAIKYPTSSPTLAFGSSVLIRS